MSQRIKKGKSTESEPAASPAKTQSSQSSAAAILGSNNSNTTSSTSTSAADQLDKFKKFEEDGVSFKAKLIGSELVMEPRGDKMCQNSIQRLKAIIKGQKAHKRRIVMKISYNGVKVCDEKTSETLYQHQVPQISFIASDDSDSRTFGYVCDVPNKAHQFICFKTSGPALQVMSEISALFEAVLERTKKQESSENGAATTPTAAESSTDFKSELAVASRSLGGQDKESSTVHAELIGDTECKHAFEAPPQDGPAKTSSSNSKSDLEDELRDFKLGSALSDLSFDLIGATAVGGSSGSAAAGDSGIMDLTFNDWLPGTQEQSPVPVSQTAGGQPLRGADANTTSAAIPIAPRPQALNFASSSYTGVRFGAQLPPMSTTPTGATVGAGSPGVRAQVGVGASRPFDGLSIGQNRSLIYNHSSVSLNDAALSHRSAFASPMSSNVGVGLGGVLSANPLGSGGGATSFTRQESTDKYAVFNDIDALPSIFESISSLASSTKQLSNAGQLLPSSQSLDHRQSQQNPYLTQQQPHAYNNNQNISNNNNNNNNVSQQHQTHRTSHQNQFGAGSNLSLQPASGVPRQMNPFDDDFFA